MSHELTADEVLAELISSFGEKHGQIVQLISNYTFQLHYEWRVFLYLFAGPKERIEVLNEASGITARLLQKTLWDNVLLRIRTLTDPAKSKMGTNLSLEHLQIICGDRIGDVYQRTLTTCQPARKYATKRLAHLDLKTATGMSTTNINRRDTTNAIKAIGELVRQFHRTTRDVDIRMMPIMTSEDEQKFLEVLYLGNQALKQNEHDYIEYLRSGEKSVTLQRSPSWVYDSSFRDSPF